MGEWASETQYLQFNRDDLDAIHAKVDTIIRRSVKLSFHPEDAEYVKDKLITALANFERELVFAGCMQQIK